MKIGRFGNAKVNKSSFWDKAAPFVFLAPAVILILCISVAPMLYSLYISTLSYNLAMPASTIKFNGLGNYVKILTDKQFLGAVGWTLQFTIVSVVAETVIGMAIAVMLSSDRSRKFSAPFKTLLLIPMMIAPVVSATIWKLMYYPIYGVINSTFQLLGIPAVNWLGETSYAKIAIILVEIWTATPFCILVYQAALKTVSPEMLDAAKVDGAGGGRIFFSIIMPTIRNFVALVVSIRIGDALRVFDVIMQMTNGAPGMSTETIGTTIYKFAFRYNDVGRGSAGAFIFFIVVSAVAFSSMIIMRKQSD